MQLLQAKDLGGFEAHPNDFFDWVMAVGSEHASAGWVAGVVGVHPWEISIMDPQRPGGDLRREPGRLGRLAVRPVRAAVPVDGGFLFTGRWPYSTGTDHSEWVILGGQVTDAAGTSRRPPDVRHFVLPRTDYAIVPDSWNVMGLQGTGSKDVIVDNVFVPDHRVSIGARMYDGSYAAERRPGSPLFAMMFGVMFTAAIASGTFGIARGALRRVHRRHGDPGEHRRACPRGRARASWSAWRRGVRRGREHQPLPVDHRPALRPRRSPAARSA